MSNILYVYFVIFQGKIKKFLPSGILVDISQKITGFVAVLHTGDVPLHHPEKKYSVGDKVKCRVGSNLYILLRKLIKISLFFFSSFWYWQFVCNLQLVHISSLHFHVFLCYFLNNFCGYFIIL